MPGCQKVLDIRVYEALPNLELPFVAAERSWITHQARIRNLNDHHFTRIDIPCLICIAHSPVAEGSEHLEAPIDHLAYVVRHAAPSGIIQIMATSSSGRDSATHSRVCWADGSLTSGPFAA